MPPDGDKPNLKDKDVLLQSDCRIHSSIPLRTQHHSVRGCCHGNRSFTSVPCFCMHYAFTLKKTPHFPTDLSYFNWFYWFKNNLLFFFRPITSVSSDSVNASSIFNYVRVAPNIRFRFRKLSMCLCFLLLILLVVSSEMIYARLR